MIKKIELLAPGGDVDSIKAAIIAGADAVYCGLDKFNARNRAANISFDDLQGILHFAHSNNCEVFLTLNIIIIDAEIPALITLLNKLCNTSIDGVIVQDFGVLYILAHHFPNLKIHASTQLTTHNKGQIEFLSKLSASRVNLSRELNLNEIQALAVHGHEHNILSEVFVHGSYCISFSGLCYISSLHGGNSGNRGRCSQPCRDKYLTTPAGKEYPLNMKDNSAFLNLKELAKAGVDSLKIEGRIKKFSYVHTVVSSWRKQLENYYKGRALSEDNSELYKVFNRNFSNGFLKGTIDKNMFIDNPRDHSLKHLSEIKHYKSNELLEHDQLAFYKEKKENLVSLESRLNAISISKAPLNITVYGACGSPLRISLKTPDATFEVCSELNLENKGAEALSYNMLMKRLKALNDTEYYINELQITTLQEAVYIPYKEISSLKNKILFLLNHSKKHLEPIQIPALKKQNSTQIKPSLSVLIDHKTDIELGVKTNATLYFQLPNSFRNQLDELIDLFVIHENLIPWFPSILIGDDYTASLEFIAKLQPKILVTNNTGIAFEAYQKGISWIAGPYLNTVNSYSLKCLKENFNCSGAFISSELNKRQIRQITAPANFNLYFSIYHPIAVMTSRQCLFHQVSECTKKMLSDTCIQQCEKTSTITDLKQHTFFIEKTKGNYHTIYNERNYLNTEIISDLPHRFTSYFIDLREVKTSTELVLDKQKTMHLFENVLNESEGSVQNIKQNILHSSNAQYITGI